MKIEVDRKALLRAMTAAASVLERRNTIPIMGNVFLEARPDGLMVRASDMDIETDDMIAGTAFSHGAITVPGLMLFDIIKKLPDSSRVSIEGDGANAWVKSGRSRFSLATLPARDYPAMSKSEFNASFTLPIADLMTIIDRVKPCMSSDELRYMLQGIYLHIEGRKLRGISTDGHRLAQMQIDAPEGAEGMPGVIIPRKTVERLGSVLKGMKGDVVVSVSELKVRFSTESLSLTSKVVDATYLQYRTIIPTEKGIAASFQTEDLRSAIDRVSSVLAERSSGVTLKLKSDTCTVLARGPEHNAQDEIAAGYDGPDVTLAFNGRYITDVTAHMGEGCNLTCKDEISPAIFSDPDDPGFFYLIMPMRIKA